MSQFDSFFSSFGFGIFLLIASSLLFVVLLREFFLWFFKVNLLEKKLEHLEESITELNQELGQLSERLSTVSIPEGKNSEATSSLKTSTTSSADTQQFPLEH